MIVIVDDERIVNIKGVYQLIDCKSTDSGIALCDTGTFFLKSEDDDVTIVHNKPFSVIDMRAKDEFKVVHSYKQMFEEVKDGKTN